MTKTNETLEYYEKNAAAFSADTLDVEFPDVQEAFASYIAEGGYILDFGCGAGRDTRYFLGRGYRVDAVDGSEKLCEIASRNTGIEVRNMLFTELKAAELYDGIWACASILHLPKADLKDVIGRMIRAVKSGGVIYTSFKYGKFEGYRNGRYFTDFTEETFQTLIGDFPETETAREWITSDARSGREDEKWLNIVLRKCVYV